MKLTSKRIVPCINDLLILPVVEVIFKYNNYTPFLCSLLDFEGLYDVTKLLFCNVYAQYNLFRNSRGGMVSMNLEYSIVANR